MMKLKLNPGEIALVLTPVEDENGWTGVLTTSISVGPEYEREAMGFAMETAVTMVATTNFIEDNPDLMEEIDFYKEVIIKEMFPAQYAATRNEIDSVYTKDGNIITLNRFTKTQGNA